MNEELLQFIWSAGIFNMEDLKTTDGLEVNIINRGRPNTDSGPDFSHARIRIGDTEWFGHVEIHIHANEWAKHKHQNDAAYNNTILHVVLDGDEKCHRKDGSILPCVHLKDRISKKIAAQYDYLKYSQDQIPCCSDLHSIDGLIITNALDRALISRLERKSKWVYEWLQNSNGDWHSVFLASLTRSFGFGINSEAFEMLALNIPMTEICKSEQNQLKISAILFGISGFLDEAPNDNFQKKLQEEWLFQKSKLNLHTLDKSIFKFMRMRPGNFPLVRLAQLACLLMDFQALMKRLMNAESIPAMLRALDVEIDAYWNTHYQFGKEGKSHKGRLSLNARQTILINALVPFLFVYGRQTGEDEYSNRALDLLQKLPSEDNRIIREWTEYGIESTSAYDSQALIELKLNHCDKRLCLNCPIGNSILSN